MTQGRAASLVAELRAHIRDQVATGYLTADEVEEGAVDSFVDDLGSQLDPAMLQRIAGVETDKAFAALFEAQRQWPALTDCDRLDRAFADLDRSGIVARQNFACCQNCGHAEIGAEIDAAERSGTKAIGYAFFHCQSTDGAVAGGDLFVYYSDLEGDAAASVRIGRAVVGALERQGLAVHWDGSRNKAVQVTLKWQRRVSQQMAQRHPATR